MLFLTALPFAVAREAVVTILSTTDLHGSIRRTPDTYAEYNDGGLLACATLIKQVRAETPHVLLVDSGDVFQGTFESRMTDGHIVATLMNALRYDAWTIGNHEFDWGLDVLSRFIHAMKAPAVVANMTVGPEALPGFKAIKPFVMRTINGVKVGIVGLTTPNIPMWSGCVKNSGLDFLQSRYALERVMPAVRKENPDILILLAHQGLTYRDDEINQLWQVGTHFGEFDLILGGHTHQVNTGGMAGKVDYVQAGAGAGGVMRVDVVFDTVQREVVRKDIHFLKASDDVPEDDAARTLVAAELKKADRALNAKLGHAKQPVISSDVAPGLSSAQQLFCEAMAWKVGADVVLHGTLSGAHLEAGPIRQKDLWRLIPYENTMAVTWLNIGELRDIMEEVMMFWGTHRYFGTWGIQYEVWPDAPPGEKIRNIRDKEGKPIHFKTRLKVALNSYHASGGGGRYPVLLQHLNSPNTRTEMLDIDIRDAVADYIRQQKRIHIPAGTNAVIRN